MARYKPHSYAHTLILPVSLEVQLIPGALEFATHMLVDSGIDVSAFESKLRNDDTGI
jgi:hypothetical protein